jgi:hypothetical protein
LLLAARQGDADAELYRLIAEYHRIVDAYNATEDYDEGSRLLVAMRPALDKINAFRPTTLCGVMAALNFADECDEPASVGPRARSEGLRALLAGIPQPDGSILITQPDGSQATTPGGRTPDHTPMAAPSATAGLAAGAVDFHPLGGLRPVVASKHSA